MLRDNGKVRLKFYLGISARTRLWRRQPMVDNEGPMRTGRSTLTGIVTGLDLVLVCTLGGGEGGVTEGATNKYLEIRRSERQRIGMKE